MTHRIVLFLAGLALAGTVFAAETPGNASFLFGGNVDITQPVEGPVHAAGGNVTVSAPVNGSVWVAGGTVRFASDAAISGDASVAGGSITIDGSIKGNLRAAGGDVRINGPVAGDASIAAGTLELGPGARIEGKLNFRGRELHRDPAAQVVGGVEQHQPRAHWRMHERTPTERFLHGWIWVAGLMVLAALIAAALPDASNRMAQELRERPWITPLLGIVALTTIPIAAVLLMITIIGIPLGVLAIIGYIALLLVGYTWLAVVVGAMLLERVKPETAARTAWRVGAAVLAMLALAVLVRVPLIGGFIKLTALVVGVGMIATAIFRHAKPAEPRPV
jgi:hypothetical protein